MSRKLFFLVSLVLLVCLVKPINASVFDPAHKIDDFEAYPNTDSMIQTGDYDNYEYWTWSSNQSNFSISPGVLVTINAPQNNVMEIKYQFLNSTSPPNSRGIEGMSSLKALDTWSWTKMTHDEAVLDAGIRMWVKARQYVEVDVGSGNFIEQLIADQNHKIHFGFIEEASDKWMSPRVSISDPELDSGGQYIFLRLADFQCYVTTPGDCSGTPTMDLENIGTFYFGPYYDGTTSTGSTYYKIWVDDIEFLPFDPDTPPDSYVYAAKNPIPYNKSACMPSNTTKLSWSPVDGATSYDVYFGTSDVFTNPVSAGQTATSYSPGPLATGTYYWRVDVSYNGGAQKLEGRLWDFTTCQKNDITFFFASDVHVSHIWQWTNRNNRELIKQMNSLPGKTYPNGEPVERPRGLLLAGDLTNWYGVPNQWYEFINYYGVNGEGRIDFPVYEGYGNHDFDIKPNIGTSDTDPDSPLTDVVIDGIKSRNEQRAEEVNVWNKSVDIIDTVDINEESYNGLHYSWDWDSVHFVNLNFYPGPGPGDLNNDAKDSFEFLKDDLANNVGNSRRPVLIYFHLNLKDNGNLSDTTRQDFYNAIKTYNVIGIFHGHDHLREDQYSFKMSDISTDPSFDVYQHSAASFQKDPDNVISDEYNLKYLVVHIDGVNNSMMVVPRYDDRYDDDPWAWTQPPSNKNWTKTISFGNTTGDTASPTPDPTTWAVEPYATSGTSISMTATIATDAEGNGVQYYFEETTGNPGSTDSGWQSSEIYEDAGLVANATYSYRVKTRDLSSNVNETEYSSEVAVTLDELFRILDTNDTVVGYYSTLQDAYDAASDGDTIQSQAVVSTENLTLDQNKSITLKSGYDSDFTTFTGETTILGNVDITAGTVTIDEGSLTITN